MKKENGFTADDFGESSQEKDTIEGEPVIPVNYIYFIRIIFITRTHCINMQY